MVSAVARGVAHEAAPLAGARSAAEPAELVAENMRGVVVEVLAVGRGMANEVHHAAVAVPCLLAGLVGLHIDVSSTGDILVDRVAVEVVLGRSPLVEHSHFGTKNGS